ncbi:MAG: DNA methyltransferase [Proteobacteria bacterium ST_bin12]|nr:MAG: DNA methyltransferase [Proteobacteria bacterium ST_bin12]
MTLSDYISIVNQRFQAGNATEHSYRGDLQQLLQTILPDVAITNEPKRIDCGAPDYILSRKDIPLGYIEAKDVGVELGHKSHKAQFDRYKAALDNLIITDYLQFHFYKQGQLVASCAIGEVSNGKVFANLQNFDLFTSLIQSFAITHTTSIKSPVKLAQMMAAKAKLMADVIDKALNEDKENNTQSELYNQYEAFKTVLIHDISHAEFADIYAQTIAYGMFAARYHDPTLPTFTRHEAATLIPQSNPFLRQLFRTIAGYNLDDNDGKRLLWIVEELVQIFLATDVASIMRNFGKATRQQDPVVHFYETFLSEYDPKLRKARGVWYTPEPVVNFIVRAVDDILKTKFNLPKGLADTSKTQITVDVHGAGKKGKTEKLTKEIHKVQILDPATGTGTFLAQTVRHIYNTQFASMQGMWPQYVKEHLIPRLSGFELLMTSYAMAHLKLDMLLTETGYVNDSASERLRIYLTNSLENDDAPDLPLFSYLSNEANEANRIKRDAPVMVVMGNPPYSVSSSNKSDWIQDLLKDYKKDLNERKINLDDDYIKFIRFGQHFIDKNGEGVLAYISNNSFIDGITHRQMRKHLLESFDEIYILDLHGNANKKEKSPDGSKDENVFDIMQGVSINLFVKTGQKAKGEMGKVFHSEMYGKREVKYQELSKSISNISWTKLEVKPTGYFFVSKDFSIESKYESYLGIKEIFNYFNSGLQTKNDDLTIHFCKSELTNTLDDLKNMNIEQLKHKYKIEKDGRDWSIEWAKKDVLNSKSGEIFTIQYKPFDYRYSYYTGNSKGFIAYPRKELTENLIRENLALATMRQLADTTELCEVLITDCVMTDRAMYSTNGTPYLFPLYTYPDSTDLLAETTRRPNLNAEIVEKFASNIGLSFTAEKTDQADSFAPIDLLDYIYAVLHSPTYRETYKEFLKIDFPRVPYPKDVNQFWQLVALGGDLRKTHLLETAPISTTISYPIAGDNVVDKLKFEDNKVYINATQYFENVPDIAWQFYIGGYQPAQKWLKDRKGRALNMDDIAHYQQIIFALTQTEQLMQAVDKVLSVDGVLHAH